jgi:two-component system sensor histidine kinase YesM
MKWKQTYRNLKIQNKFFLITIAMLSVVCVISMVAVQIATEIYEAKVFEESGEVLTISSTVVDYELRKIEKLSFQMLTDEKVQQYLQEMKENTSESPDYHSYKTKDLLRERTQFLSHQEKYISSVQTVDAAGGMITVGLHTDVRGDPLPYIRLVREAKGAIVWIPSSEEPNTLIAAREVRKTENLDLGYLGTLIIRIRMDRLIQDTLELSEDKIFMIAHGGEMIMSTNPSYAGALSSVPIRGDKGFQVVALYGKEYFVTHKISKHQRFTFYNVLPYEEVFQQSKVVKNGLVVLYALLFLLSLYFVRKAARSITRPLEDLTQTMKRVQKGDFDTDALFQAYEVNMDETGHIQRHFRLALEKINELIRENYHKQLIIKETEYKALQAQMNPHFLYNTLESIHLLAKMNRQTDISRMAESLGSLLRGIISRKDAMISIHEELGIVTNYITIQRIRFGDRLDYQVALDPLIGEFYIPKLTIQPLIENAIKHGLEWMSEPCRIRLQLVGQENHIDIMIEDNGPGFTARTLGDIYAGDPVKNGTSIGLQNIIDRVRLLFGEMYGVDIANRPEGGASIRVRIPYCLEGEYV